MNHFHRLFTSFLISLFLIVFSGYQKAEMNADLDREAIEAVVGQLLKALNSGDAAAAAVRWGKEGTFLAPNQPMVMGRENIQASLQGMIDMGLTELKAKTVKLEVMGDIAYRIGKYDLTIQPEGGDSIQDNGKFVQVFKREDYTWKVVVGIFNTDMPMPSAM